MRAFYLLAPGAGLPSHCSGQAHTLCSEALAISSSFFFLFHPFSSFSRLTAFVRDIGPSLYNGADRPCWRIRFMRSVVIPVYNRPSRSMIYIHQFSTKSPHIRFSSASRLENKKPSVKEGFIIFWLPEQDSNLRQGG